MFGAWNRIYSKRRSAGGAECVRNPAGLRSSWYSTPTSSRGGITNNIPKVYAWTAAFGLVVTLVWLYLEDPAS
ncbi:MAG: Bax inhibitor-1/YccA family protein [Kineosporiaceae bacterium]|nr:Bax inhibitor-1/YccA family protein [Kineosporiaceae bacterium]